VKENASYFIGVSLSSVLVEGVGLSGLLEKRLGIYSDDEHITSLSEFAVQNSRRSRVLLCLSETCLIERDPGTYAVIYASLIQEKSLSLELLQTTCIISYHAFYSNPITDLVLAPFVNCVCPGSVE
jgi:hypothetical protein